jgi:acyl-CoA reductase-like NAD-dependent aldehyde dehydrogenase
VRNAAGRDLMPHRIARPILALAVVAVALSGGCASKSQGEKMVESFSETRRTLAESRTHVGMTLTALQGVRTARPEDLERAFRHYKDSVVQLENEGRDAKGRAKAMKEEADAHVKQWQEEMETIKDSAIKASLESRREAVSRNFKLIQMYAQDVRKAYGPFLQGNKDIVQALSIDLSPAGVTSLATSLDRVMTDGKRLDERLWSMERALDNIANGMSPLGPMK